MVVITRRYREHGIGREPARRPEMAVNATGNARAEHAREADQTPSRPPPMDGRGRAPIAVLQFGAALTGRVRRSVRTDTHHIAPYCT
jgi:hypothetical protein